MPPSQRLPPRPAAVIAFVALAATSPRAVVPIVKESVVRIGIQAVCVRAEGSKTVALPDLEVSRGTPSSVEGTIPWSGPSGQASLRVAASVEAGISDEPRVRVEARLAVPGEAPVTASRPWSATEGGSTLFPVYDTPDGKVVLTLRSEVYTRAVVRNLASLGPPVRFRLEVERVLGERTVPLETNDLDTFVGEPVEYSFRRGADETLEWLRLVLTPIRIEGEVAEIRAEVSGGLPGQPAPVVLHRTESLVTTRGAASSFAVVSGEPASGYRFLVAAQF